MLTFVFLVGLTATTLLLLSVAAEEALRVSRALLTRRGVEGNVPSRDVPNHSSRELSEVRHLPPRPRAQPKGKQPLGDDQVPDRAA